MRGEILIKNGEIRILRDSMQQMESALEEQRKARTLLENENAQSLNEKEKEFSRKVLFASVLIKSVSKPYSLKKYLVLVFKICFPLSFWQMLTIY